MKTDVNQISFVNKTSSTIILEAQHKVLCKLEKGLKQDDTRVFYQEVSKQTISTSESIAPNKSATFPFTPKDLQEYLEKEEHEHCTLHVTVHILNEKGISIKKKDIYQPGTYSIQLSKEKGYLIK